jgi:hypothetical protein
VSAADQFAECIEDAFLQCLEEGANLPREFTVSLPWPVFVDLQVTVLTVAGFTIRLVPIEDTADDAEWIH